jgi:hypothetical protein
VSGQNDHTLDIGFKCNLAPSAKFVSISANCTGATGADNGKVVMISMKNVDKYGISTGASYSGPAYAGASTLPGILPFEVVSGIPNASGGTYTIRVFAGTDLCYHDYTVAVSQATCPSDQMGYIYCEETGDIIVSGSLSVSGPGAVLLAMDGSTGAYQFYTDGTPGDYVLTYTPPAGYTLSQTRQPAGPFLDPTGGANPYVVGAGSANGTKLNDYSAGANPFYMVFRLAPGDPEIKLNNIPLKGCCAPVCGQTTVVKN